MDHLTPGKSSILEAAKEYRHLGTEAFLDKYTNGSSSRTLFLVFDDQLYPLKAIYCAAHEPPIDPRLVNSTKARKELKDLGFTTRQLKGWDVVRSPFSPHKPGELLTDDEAQEVAGDGDAGAEETSDNAALTAFGMEGDYVVKERKLIRRNSALVKLAKAHYPAVCQACNFDFFETYGRLGYNYIEAQHIDPLSGRQGRREPTTVLDFAMLCSNCHSMIHAGITCLKVDELKEIVDRNRKAATLKGAEAA